MNESDKVEKYIGYHVKEGKLSFEKHPRHRRETLKFHFGFPQENEDIFRWQSLKQRLLQE